MNHSARRVLRATVSVVGLAALGVSLTGIAYAASASDPSDPDAVYPSCSAIYDKHDYGGLFYNGDQRDDEDYSSDDYDPDCTGFHGKSENNGYNGYDGKDPEGYRGNHYRFAPL